MSRAYLLKPYCLRCDLLNTRLRYVLSSFTWLLQIALLFGPMDAFAQAPTFHSDVNLVNVTFSARDTGGKLE